MALRTFQLCVVFAIGLSKGPAPAAGEELLSLNLQDPQDVTVSRGQAATLRCRVNSTEVGVTVTWLYGNQPILPNDTRQQIQEDGSLFIPKVAGKKLVSVEGSYSCLVRNSIGALLSNPIKLKTAMLAKEFSAQPEDVSVFLDQPVLLPCQIQSTPMALIEWRHNDLPLRSNQNYIPLPSGDLLITMVRNDYLGLYKCTAYNEILKRRVESSEAALSIQRNEKQNPKILSVGEATVRVQVGTAVPLYCFASGWPKPNIRWTYNTTLFLGNSSILWLHNVTASQTGKYSCTASNNIGQVSQVYDVDVIVIQAPYFTVTPLSQWFPSARTVRLECTAKGIPRPEIKWLKNGEPLSLGGRIKKKDNELVLSHTFTTDTGLYQCVAENKYGRIWSAARLTANFSNDRPPPPVNVRCTPYDQTSICLQWDAPPNINATAFSIHSFYADLGPDYLTNRTYKLAEKLNPNTNYSFYVRLYSTSASDQSQNITCETVLTGSRTFEFIPISSVSLRVEWTSLSSDKPCGGTADYKLQWRRYRSSSNNAVRVSNNYFIVPDLRHSERYEVRVQTSNTEDDELPWTEYTMPNISEGVDLASDPESEFTEPDIRKVIAPVQIEVASISPHSVNITWRDPRDPADKSSGGYFMTCYSELKLQQNCENNRHIKFIKSTSPSIEITDLKSYTSYEFRVRSHNLDGTFSQFSYSVELKTLEYVPDPVSNLEILLENITSVCLRWRVPKTINGKLKYYLISYTFGNQSLENWTTSMVSANRVSIHGCWPSDKTEVSQYLTGLESNRQYKFVVRAATKAGLSAPSNAVNVKTAPPLFIQTTEPEPNQKLGIIVGLIIAMLCIISCISCMIFRRRCFKTRALERARMFAPRSTNGQSQPTGSTPLRATCLPLADGRSEIEAHELQCLVAEENATSSQIPSIPQAHAHIDTKGGVGFPNGQVNEIKFVSNGHISNGIVHITENPQFDTFGCNGHYTSNSESHQLLQTDRNPSNADDSSSLLLNDTLFNLTRLTSLDESLSRTRSLVLEPNG